jgi:hypothetical protein
MSIRKIPLKRHANIAQDLSLSSMDDTEQLPGHQSDDYLASIRAKVLTDRALNDKVSPYSG